jgi:hypothetical protein
MKFCVEWISWQSEIESQTLHANFCPRFPHLLPELGKNLRKIFIHKNYILSTKEDAILSI